MDWHFSRTALAQQHLKFIQQGVIQRATIYAPRRSGKTQYLRRDLAPLAEKAGFIAVYANFWEQPSQPQVTLIGALQTTVEAVAKKRSLWKRLSEAKISKLKIEAALGSISKMSAETDFSLQPQAPSSSELAIIAKLFRELADLAKKRRILLLIDEIQHLASRAEFEPLTFSLRTLLDTHSPQVVSILTGSSESQLLRMFSDRAAAFYQSATHLEFPHLDRDFVSHIARCYQQITKQKISVDALMKAFKIFHALPHHLVALVRQMILTGEKNPLMAVKSYAEEFEMIERDTNPSLDPLEEKVMALVKERKPLFAQATLNELKDQRLLEGGKSQMQKAVRRLEQKGYLIKDHRATYRISR